MMLFDLFAGGYAMLWTTVPQSIMWCFHFLALSPIVARLYEVVFVRYRYVGQSVLRRVALYDEDPAESIRPYTPMEPLRFNDDGSVCWERPTRSDGRASVVHSELLPELPSTPSSVRRKSRKRAEPNPDQWSLFDP